MINKFYCYSWRTICVTVSGCCSSTRRRVSSEGLNELRANLPQCRMKVSCVGFVHTTHTNSYVHKIKTLFLHKTHYRPQRSWAKVIFSQACVKNSVHGGGGGGRVSASVHAGIPPPDQAPPPRADPPEQTPPQSRPPPGDQAHPPPRRPGTPPGKQTAAYGQ